MHKLKISALTMKLSLKFTLLFYKCFNPLLWCKDCEEIFIKIHLEFSS